MGMSSSQARLLSLTARLHDIEYKAQKLEAEKLRLANNSTRVYEEYLNALDATKIQYSALTCDGSITYLDATLNAMENGVISGYDGETSNEILFLQNQDGAIIVTPAVAEKYGLVEGEDLGTLDEYLEGLGYTKSTRDIYSEKEVTDYDTITGFTKIANTVTQEPSSSTTYTYNPVKNITNAEVITNETSTLTEGSTYVIDSAEGLQQLATLVNSGASTQYVTIIMTANIDMSDIDDWEGIGTSDYRFQGTFDGNGYTISNLTGSQGLFGYTDGATIKNVNIENANINNTDENLSGVGALIGTAKNTKVDNCSVSGTVTSAGKNVGGAIGYASKCTVENSSANCIVRCEYENLDFDYDGGNSASETRDTYAGGFAGTDESSNYTNCTVEGEVYNTGLYTGGFVGHQGGESYFKDCSTSADVYSALFNGASGTQYVDNYCGTFGATYQGTVNIDGCSATGRLYCGTSGNELDTFFYISNSNGAINGENESSSTATGASGCSSEDVTLYTIPSEEDYIQNIIAVLIKAGAYDPYTASEDEENTIKSKIKAFLGNFNDDTTDYTKLYYLNEAIVAYLNGTGSDGLGEALAQDIESGKVEYTENYCSGTIPENCTVERNTTSTGTDTVSYDHTDNNGLVTIPTVENIAEELYYAIKQADSETTLTTDTIKTWLENHTDDLTRANINELINKTSNYANSSELSTIIDCITSNTEYSDRTYYDDNYDVQYKTSDSTIEPTYGTKTESEVTGHEYYWDTSDPNIANAMAVWTMAKRGGFIIASAEQAASTTWLTNMIEVGAAVFTTFDITQVGALDNYSSEEIINMSDAEYNDLMGIVNTSVATNTSLREVADETNLKKAEAKYEADMKKIDLKDRRYDTDLAAVETEREAIVDEIDTLKTVAKDNVDRTFKLFS